MMPTLYLVFDNCILFIISLFIKCHFSINWSASHKKLELLICQYCTGMSDQATIFKQGKGCTCQLNQSLHIQFMYYIHVGPN